MAPLTSLFKFTAYRNRLMTNTKTVDIREVLNDYSHSSNPYGLILPFSKVLIDYRSYWLPYLYDIPSLLKFKEKTSMVYNGAENMLNALKTTLLTLPHFIDYEYFSQFVKFVANVIDVINGYAKWAADMGILFKLTDKNIKINVRDLIPRLNLSRRRLRLYRTYLQYEH